VKACWPPAPSASSVPPSTAALAPQRTGPDERNHASCTSDRPYAYVGFKTSPIETTFSCDGCLPACQMLGRSDGSYAMVAARTRVVREPRPICSQAWDVWGPDLTIDQLTQTEKVELSGSIIDLAKFGRRLINFAILSPPPTGSGAQRQLTHQINAAGDDGGLVRRAHEAMLFATLAGWDIGVAFATLLRGRQPATVSLALITRGAVEAFSRAHWLLAAGSTEELVRRHLSIAIGDLGYHLKHAPGEPLRTAKGEAIDAVARRDLLQSELLALQIGNKLLTKPTNLATAFLDATVGGGVLKYSRLSGVSHGESYAVHSFVDLEVLHSEMVALTLPRNVAIEYAGYLIVAGRAIGEQVVDLFEPPRGERERWQAAMDRASSRYVPIDETRGVPSAE